MILPQNERKFIDLALDVIEQCRVSVGSRMALARQMKQLRYTGSTEGDAALYNKLGPHIDRLSSYLFSPAGLRFNLSFENYYEKQTLMQAEMAARVLTREFSRRDIDMQFGQGVDTALTYGACIPKLIWGHGGMTCKLVQPWQFGVYREDKNDLSEQEAVTETSYITPHDLWRRISHLPNAEELFRKARSYARKNSETGDSNSYFNQVILSGTNPIVQTTAPFTTQTGGLVQTGSDPSGAVLAPTIAQELITFHELWVIDDLIGDYITIQIVEPDILIAPIYKRKNLFVPEYLPYSKIQPNAMAGYFWGRSEIADLARLQQLLKERLDDIRKLMSLQYDRMLAFTGFSGMNDDRYDQFRQAGWISADEPNGKVEDLTPQLPQNAFADVEVVLRFMDEIAGFSNILSGQGEAGVRAGNHAETLLKTASPRLRDRALLVERQCADLGDRAFQLMAAKDPKAYWIEDAANPEKGKKGEFTLSQLPDDLQIEVDSHSSSPIYQDDHKQTIAFLAKLNAINGESVLDLLPDLPMRDMLKARLKEDQAAKAQLIQQHPELLTGGKKHQPAVH